VAAPTTNDQLIGLLAEQPRRGMIARGLGRSYGDPAQNAGGLVVDMTNLDQLLDINLDRAEVTVEAGISLDRLMRLTVPLGLFVPVTPGTRHVTVGGAIAADIHGKNHHRDGSFARHVRRFSLATVDGRLQDVTAENDPDAFFSTAGGMGLTGFIVDATIQMIPVETSWMRVDTEQAANLDDVMDRMLHGDAPYQYSVAWVDTMASGRALGRSVHYRANHAHRDELTSKQARNPLAFGPPVFGAIPRRTPTGLVNPAVVRTFNEVWYRKAKLARPGALQSIGAFFHQLDLVDHLNHAYGSGGFVQHQFVVPLDRAEVVRSVIEELSRLRCPSFLVVLKRMGPQEGLLSFPMEGWTLAVDIPASFPGLADLLDQFDQRVVENGGRVYLAKDARMRPELLPAMYPRLAEWRSVVERLDPEGRLQSDLGRRLALRSGGTR
jgi:decaprenylphospho-beta-D-ribofuranose 2-oxidase